MILLTSTSDLLQVVSGSAVTVDVHASWVDLAAGTTTPGRTNTAITTATTTTVVGSPAASTQRNVKMLSIRNKHASSSNAITLQHTDGTTVVEIFKYTLGAGEEILYFEGLGILVIDASGQAKGTSGGSGRLLRVPQFLTAGTTYNPPAGCNALYVECIAGGGGGGGTSFSSPNMGFGGGGAAGGYCAKYFTGPAASITYAIGAAGSGGATTPAAGGTGGDTTITVSGTLLTAKGGLGGALQAGAATLDAALGGQGVISTNGDINSAGDPGQNSVRLSGILGSSGGGGSSPWGGGGAGRKTNGVGQAGLGFGAGGAGGAAVSASQVGGAGTAGAIRIWEYS